MNEIIEFQAIGRKVNEFMVKLRCRNGKLF